MRGLADDKRRGIAFSLPMPKHPPRVGCLYQPMACGSSPLTGWAFSDLSFYSTCGDPDGDGYITASVGNRDASDFIL